MRAVWNGNVLAESEATITIEGNEYFPPDSVRMQYFTPSDTHTTCPWKGEASYYNVMVQGDENLDAAWYYPEPKNGAIEKVGEAFTGYVAFWHGVEVEPSRVDQQMQAAES